MGNKTIKIKKHKDSNYVFTDENGMLLFDMGADEKNGCVINSAKLSYEQEGDNEKEHREDSPNILEIELTSEGFYVMKTDRWAFDSLEDLLIPIKDFMSKFTVASWSDIEETDEKSYVLKRDY